eukprot:2527354-Amphidinium_carterae.1
MHGSTERQTISRDAEAKQGSHMGMHAFIAVNLLLFCEAARELASGTFVCVLKWHSQQKVPSNQQVDLKPTTN